MPVHCSVDKLSIQGFRCIRELDLPPVEKPLYLTGANNSGKTAILEALVPALGGSFHQFTSEQLTYRPRATVTASSGFTTSLRSVTS